MAKGQLTYLQLANRVLMRLGKAQVTTLQSVTTDSWADIVKTFLNDAQGELAKENDWSTLVTSGTFTTSSRTYNLATSFSDFQREIDLVSTTNLIVLQPVASLALLDQQDAGQTNTGNPTRYSIEYPNLLFNRTPSSEAFRLRYVQRPTVLSANADTSGLPEACDLALIWWVVWQLQATREDAEDGGASAYRLYTQTLSRAIQQDGRRMDVTRRLRSAYAHDALRDLVPFPPAYDRNP